MQQVTPLAEDDIKIVRYATPEMWDQMRDLVRQQGWYSQDEAVWNLLPEMKNVYPIFALNKRDNTVLGGVTLVETDVVFGAFYVMRPDLRGLGVGMKMMVHLVEMIDAPSRVKPVLARGVKDMIGKYSGPPFYAIHHAEMYAFSLPRQELLSMFPSSGSTFVPVSFKDMSDDQFHKVCEFDTLVSGRKRESFLKDYHSLFFTRGIALLDGNGDVHGMVGAVPLIADSQKFKIGPLFAKSQEDACYLIKCILHLIPNPDAKFVLNISTNTAGDWILQKCREANIPLTFAGTVANSTYNKIIYKDPCNEQLMFAPMNCPIFFDR
ncbi:unnamed protein product [Nippostrongylus brasiliensis]|uniref:N-acetyltransferase domain-containing protein n=1 Tax=Nippostrongylus brasiliensis TaxID=27835 RepID=A0A0N4Y064_NIPBR|nr:hypothetical protein Q1695_001442 [Nippostrongylus brasiliensis]VDL72473.1 unnamed protein product [Nippostrongylus brasiliensis]